MTGFKNIIFYQNQACLAEQQAELDRCVVNPSKYEAKGWVD
jgi:hypothetical protein